MKIAAARTWHSRLVGRTTTDPTASARALRAVLDAHQPVQAPDHPAHALCAGMLAGACPADAADLADILDAYPCATAKTVALEFGVPVPARQPWERDERDGGLIDV